MKSRTNIKRFLVDWAAVLALLVCFIAFTAYKGNSFMSTSNMVNILRAMAINTVFGIAATITMAPDGFDMSAGTLASCSAYVFVSAYLWLGQSLGMSILICILATLVMYQLTMFLILVCKIPDMLATCALMFVHQGIGQWYIGGGAVPTGPEDFLGSGTCTYRAFRIIFSHWTRSVDHYHHAGLCACGLSFPQLYQARTVSLRYGRQ